jgi:hypothetical protein
MAFLNDLIASGTNRLNTAIDSPLFNAGIALATTGVGYNPILTAFQGYKSALDTQIQKRKEEEAKAKEESLRGELFNAYQSGDMRALDKAVVQYSALPNANSSALDYLTTRGRENLVGVKGNTGYVVDPNTGASKFVEETPYEIQKRNADLEQSMAYGRMDRQSQLSMAEAEQKNAWDVQDRDTRLQHDWDVRQADAAVEGEKIRMQNEDYNAKEEYALNKIEAQGNKEVYTAEMKAANSKYDEASNAFTAANDLEKYGSALGSVPLVNRAAGLAEKTLGVGGDAGEAMVNMSGVIDRMAIGVHPGGPMTDADLKVYRTVILDPNQSAESRNKAIQKAKIGAEGNLRVLEAKRDYYNQTGSLRGWSDIEAQMKDAYRKEAAGI